MICLHSQHGRNLVTLAAWSILIVSAFALCGCGQVVRVNRANTPLNNSLSKCEDSGNKNGCKLPGIPFYGVGYRCVQTSVWVQPIYTVSISVKYPDNTTHNLSSKIFTRDDYLRKVQIFLFGLSGTQVNSLAEEKTLADKWEAQTGVPDPYDIDEDAIDKSNQVYLYSNSIAAERYVDTTNTMFLNTSKPLAGSAQATATLGADGTLTTGSAQEESKTLATLTALIPTSDLVKAGTALALIYNPSGTPQPPTPSQPTYTFQTTTKIDLYKHTHNKQVAGVPPCGVPKNKDDVVTSPANVTVEHIGDLPTPAPASDTTAPKKP